MTQPTFIDRCIKDSHGKVVLGQSPNVPILGWIVCLCISKLHTSAHIQSGFSFAATSFLFTWAFLELKSGVNYFRRVLGLVVLVALLIQHFSL